MQYTLIVEGVVQGVGFRPFVHRLATELSISGTVENSGRDVKCHIEGPSDLLDTFLIRLRTEAPPLADIQTVSVSQAEAEGMTGFGIVPSSRRAVGLTMIPPDVSMCSGCAAEVSDPGDRRFSYAFTCCTDCGPRYTVVRTTPYDRAATSMAEFELCESCRTEYEDPGDRRFHAQATCCPACGPQLTFTRFDSDIGADVGSVAQTHPIAAAIAMLTAGGIVAIKGIGGYQLVCRADRADSVRQLRERKHRDEKPFALLVATLDDAERLIEADDVARQALIGVESPVVLAPAQPASGIVAEVAPGTGLLGVMLPSTPLHLLLSNGVDAPLVCTSGNRSNEPIVVDDDTALAAFETVADGLLGHDRHIERRADDSVGHVVAGRFQLLRRARGYAPRAVSLPAVSGAPILGVGAELKNTVCLAIGDQAAVSVHLGDLKNPATLRSFERAISDQLDFATTVPELIVHDLHPEYLSTKFATAQDIAPTLAVQHHHAHLVSCLIDNQYLGPAIGVTFDGFGWGTDGTAWGGEFLVGDAAGYSRAAHLGTVALPGGSAAVRAPWRMAVSYLVDAFGELPGGPLFGASTFADQQPQLDAVVALCSSDTTTRTSSIGRLFDAVAALCGVAQTVSYEGQAAIGLEQLAVASPGSTRSYAWSTHDEGTLEPTAGELIRQVYADVIGNVDRSLIAWAFHRSVAELIADTCVALRDEAAVETVALTGGVFQNRLLVELTLPLLTERNFQVLRHRQVPPNDGGISLGQVAIGRAHLLEKGIEFGASTTLAAEEEA